MSFKNFTKTFFATGILATASQSANANVEQENFSPEKENVCQSERIMKNAQEKAFVVIQGTETKRNKLTVCENGEKIFESAIATGKPQKDGGVYTPEGRFPMGRLDKNKVSGSYKSGNKPAKMPYAVHVHKGIWIHQGRVRNQANKILQYPSHGCIRLEKGRAADFYEIAKTLKATHGKIEIIVEGTNPRTKTTPNY